MCFIPTIRSFLPGCTRISVERCDTCMRNTCMDVSSIASCLDHILLTLQRIQLVDIECMARSRPVLSNQGHHLSSWKLSSHCDKPGMTLCFHRRSSCSNGYFWPVIRRPFYRLMPSARVLWTLSQRLYIQSPFELVVAVTLLLLGFFFPRRGGGGSKSAFTFSRLTSIGDHEVVQSDEASSVVLHPETRFLVRVSR